MVVWEEPHLHITDEEVDRVLRRTITAEEHFECFETMLEFVTLQALLAFRKKTYSYRGFKVGCAVYAHNGESMRAFSMSQVFSAGNEKRPPQMVKFCAERKAIQKAHTEGFNHIVGMVIVGRPQPDADSLLITPTLHPCLACRNFFQSTEGITAKTRIVCVNPFKGEYERFTVGELLSLHRPL